VTAQDVGAFGVEVATFEPQFDRDCVSNPGLLRKRGELGDVDIDPLHGLLVGTDGDLIFG
jgi:hypothetical protein